jgi:hypothetical protein
MAPVVATDAELNDDVLSLKDDSHRPSWMGSQKSSEEETKLAPGPSGLAVLNGQNDSDSSIDLQEKRTGAVVLPWRVKVPALVLVIFFTCKSTSLFVTS